MKFTKTLTAAAIIAAGLAFSAQAAEKVKIAMVVKSKPPTTPSVLNR